MSFIKEIDGHIKAASGNWDSIKRYAADNYKTALTAGGIGAAAAGGLSALGPRRPKETRMQKFRRVLQNAAGGALVGTAAGAAIPAGAKMLTSPVEGFSRVNKKGILGHAASAAGKLGYAAAPVAAGAAFGLPGARRGVGRFFGNAWRTVRGKPTISATGGGNTEAAREILRNYMPQGGNSLNQTTTNILETFSEAVRRAKTRSAVKSSGPLESRRRFAENFTTEARQLMGSARIPRDLKRLDLSSPGVRSFHRLIEAYDNNKALGQFLSNPGTKLNLSPRQLSDLIDFRAGRFAGADDLNTIIQQFAVNKRLPADYLRFANANESIRATSAGKDSGFIRALAQSDAIDLKGVKPQRIGGGEKGKRLYQELKRRTKYGAPVENPGGHFTFNTGGRISKNSAPVFGASSQNVLNYLASQKNRSLNYMHRGYSPSGKLARDATLQQDSAGRLLVNGGILGGLAGGLTHKIQDTGEKLFGV
jgi:hypothetical protein